MATPRTTVRQGAITTGLGDAELKSREPPAPGCSVMRLCFKMAPWMS